MSDYQGHAAGYQSAKRQPWRTYLEQPSALALLGDLSHQTVLDLGCGEGHYSRLLKQLGAAQVLGVDLSSDMVELARAQERSHPVGIDYRVGDAGDLTLAEPVDLVFAGYLFNHARNRKELRAQCITVSNLLRPGGRLVALNNNPDDPPSNFEAGHAPTATARASMAPWWRVPGSTTASSSRTVVCSSSPITTSAAR